MSKKTNNGGKASGAKSAPAKTPAGSKSRNNQLLIVGAVAAVIAVVAFAVFNMTGKKVTPSPEEQKYIGRYLPSGYQEAKVADAISYTATVKATQVQTTKDASGISIATADVASNKIVKFEYDSKNGKMPLVAYVKPSGKLFVGVDYCIPCQGVGQRIESDGSLTCETCGTTRDLETGAGLSGACKRYPLDELPVKVAGGKITIEKSALDKWTPQPKDRPIGG